MVDPVPVTPPTEAPQVAPAATTPADKPKKKLTAKEMLADMSANADVATASADAQVILKAYFKGNEEVLANYVEASQKTTEARLKAGLPPTAPKPDDQKAVTDEKAARDNLTRTQRRELEKAEAAEKKALAAVDSAIGSAPKKGEDLTAADKDAVRGMVAAYAQPKAKEAHSAMLTEVKDKLTKRTGGLFGSAMPKRIKAVIEAGSDPAKLKAAKDALAEEIARDKYSKDLSKADQLALVEALSGNAAAALEENKKANPVVSKVTDMTEQVQKAAVAEVTNIPTEIVRTAMNASGATAVSPLLNAAQKIIPGIPGFKI